MSFEPDYDDVRWHHAPPLDECGCVYWHGICEGRLPPWSPKQPSLDDATTWHLYPGRCLNELHRRAQQIRLGRLTFEDHETLVWPFRDVKHVRVYLVTDPCYMVWPVRREYALHHSYAESPSVQRAIRAIKFRAWSEGRVQVVSFLRSW